MTLPEEATTQQRFTAEQVESIATSLENSLRCDPDCKCTQRLAVAMLRQPARAEAGELTFKAFRKANRERCLKWHPAGIASWSPCDWLTAVTGELGELASLLKMRNRERDGLPGNKFSPTQKQVADELADVLTYLDLLAAVLGVDLGRAAVEKFNEVSERVGFPDRILPAAAPCRDTAQEDGEIKKWLGDCSIHACLGDEPAPSEDVKECGTRLIELLRKRGNLSVTIWEAASALEAALSSQRTSGEG